MSDTYQTLIELLIEKKLTVVTAESLTGGMLCSKLTDIPGASKTVHGGFIVYCNAAKQNMIGVSAVTLKNYSAISAETAAEMAKGAAITAGTNIAISATGNAGPTAADDKPVGQVYVGVYINGRTVTRELTLLGDRSSIRKQACLLAADFCLKELKKDFS